jgi:hypothetical protein
VALRRQAPLVLLLPCSSPSAARRQRRHWQSSERGDGGSLPRLASVGCGGARSGCATEGGGQARPRRTADGTVNSGRSGRCKRARSGPRRAWMGLILICFLVIFVALMTSPDTLGLFMLHECVWGIYPGHGGGGRLLRRRWPANFVRLDSRISRSGI